MATQQTPAEFDHDYGDVNEWFFFLSLFQEFWITVLMDFVYIFLMTSWYIEKEKKKLKEGIPNAEM